MPIDWDKRVRQALSGHLSRCGWKWTVIPRLGTMYQKDEYALSLDAIGIFLYGRVDGPWQRLQGLSYSNMRSLIETPEITFMDGSTFTFSGGA